ncbi:MAG: RNA-processing protein [Candidatus Lokiarchaeota archaeon]|nr:RNA-processing protein [Candidatus Lokiarchaeota archaeon]
MNKDRVAVLIGKNGITKKKIQFLTNTQIEVDSTTGEYSIIPVEDQEDDTPEMQNILDQLDITPESLNIYKESPNFGMWTAKKIIEAINMGFKPEKAFKLINQDCIFEIISLEDILGNSQKTIKRIKGRLIGEKGIMRKSIEKYTNAHISVYQNQIGFIADFDSLKIAQKAVDMIIEGLPHKTVLAFLQKRYREKKEKEFHETWKPTFD